jgi:type VI secretion system secreted protein VgrG
MDKTMPTASERIELITPLGDELLFHGMHADEEMSRLGEYQLDLLSKNNDVDRDKILGAKVSVRVMLKDGEVRYFNGFVTHFSAGAALGKYARYHATVSPWLWFLTRTADCRIFQDKTVRQIVEDVFADHQGVADFAFELTETYRTWNYCVQYRETDFNFVSRLLEHEGMYYYYRHTDGHHTLVITDSVDKHDPTPGYEKLQYIAPQVVVRPGTEYINSWNVSRQVQPGAYAHRDYDFERPNVDLIASKTLPRGYTPSDYEIFDYPGFYLQKPHGEHYAHVRIDEYGARFETAQATTNYRGVNVGARFELEAQNPENQRFNGKYLVIRSTHTLESTQYEAGDTAGEGLRCSFTALSCSQQFRPRRLTPKPFVQGPQTAVVVGPQGDEIYTDQYGRVKVQFHWDRRGQRNENSSCWIRVSHPWAGKGWGSVATPRIGQEVIVDFLEGDPDQPIITGRVYNQENQPPFGFPAGAVISGVKSDTHKGGGFNEISCDDTAGKEKVTVHAQYDMNTTVLHDQANEIKNNRTTHVIVDDTLNVDANRTMHVKGKLAETVDAGHELTVTGGYTETISGGATRTINGGQTETINGGNTVTINGGNTEQIDGGATMTINGKHEETVSGKRSMDVTGDIGVTASGKIDIHATGAGTYSSDATLTLSVAGSTIEIAPGGITITHGGSSIKVDPAGVSVMGPKISLNG